MSALLKAISVMTIFSVIGLFLIVQFTSPKTNSGQLISINLVYFFLALFLSLAGTATLVLYWLGSLRLKFERKGGIDAVTRPKLILKRSFRQAFLFSTVIIVILVLRSLNFANPLNIVLLVSAAILIEVYFFGH